MAQYKIPNTPTARASSYEFADYLELLCFVTNNGVSITNAHRQINYISDEIGDGDYDEDDKLYDLLQDALKEIDRREIACRGRYPFTTDNNSIFPNPDCSRSYEIIYKYLLLATRLNMIQHKYTDTINGTLIFESLSALVAKEYFGNNAKSIVFGTGCRGGFRDKINDLTHQLGEGGKYKDPEEGTHDEKDGGLDIVVWKPFTDMKKGKFIGFGQCKTGTEWRDEVGRLCPNDFCSIYFDRQPYIEPVKMFFVCETFKDNYEKLSRKAGIIFDRCRIMDFLPELPDSLLNDINHWVNGKQELLITAYSN